MTVRIGQTRTTSRLLKTVGGKPHATKDDHQEEEDVNRDPDSSGDEIRVPPTKSKLTQNAEYYNEDGLRQPPPSNRKRKAEQKLPAAEPGSGLNVPGAKKKNARAAAPRVPERGQFQRSRAAKDGFDPGKENTTAAYTPPNSSQGNVWDFNPLLVDSSQSPQNGKKRTFGSKARTGQTTANIHAAPPPIKKAKYGNKKKLQDPIHEEDDEESDVYMVDDPSPEDQPVDLGVQTAMSKLEPNDPELRKVPQKKKKVAQANGETTETCKMDDTELDALLKPTLREQLGLENTSHPSLPSSSAPQEDMENIDTYVRTLPTSRPEDTCCAICHAPVSSDTYWAFWKGLPRTVKNQAKFCFSHRRATAASEYGAEGYPTIDWPRLPDRIKKHRMALYSILANETPSSYRARYAPLALTGKAASIPKTRTDLSTQKQEELSSTALDDAAVYPGYYGPRGRRLITESVMALLASEIKRSTDPVVQTSGPASFVQAVLVPEVAVMLIMEDLVCDRDEADECRERTYEMGCLLNEEIEDEVVVGEGEEEEGKNEYQGE